MFFAIDDLRLQLGLCPNRLMLLARYSAKREDIGALTDMSAVEQFDLLEMMRIMRDYGRPVSFRCATAS